MPARKFIGLVRPLALALVLSSFAIGCGESAPETKSDGSVELAPGTVDLSNETAPPKSK